MTVVPSLDYTAWSKLFPEFGNGIVEEPTAALYWGVATRFVNNADDSRVPADPTTYEPRRTILLYVTAHIAKLQAPTVAGGAPSGLVGRISDAAEGTVNVSVALAADVEKRAGWYAQTPYGLTAWQMMGRFRTARYRHRGRGNPAAAGMIQLATGQWAWPR
jgi:uncharacterized protein DUF4054